MVSKNIALKWNYALCLILCEPVYEWIFKDKLENVLRLTLIQKEKKFYT